MLNAIALTRNQLTEQLLGLEIAIRFISLREAKSLHAGTGDDSLLERALHVPMRLAIEGENDITVLAVALGEALSAQGSSPASAQAVVSLLLEKNQGTKATPAAGSESPRMLTAIEIAMLRQDMSSSYQQLLAMRQNPSRNRPKENPPIKDEKS